MGWVLLLAAIWVLVAVGTALFIAATIRLADREDRATRRRARSDDAESA